MRKWISRARLEIPRDREGCGRGTVVASLSTDLDQPTPRSHGDEPRLREQSRVRRFAISRRDQPHAVNGNWEPSGTSEISTLAPSPRFPVTICVLCFGANHILAE